MDNLTELYCHIDDFYQAFKPQFERQLIENGTSRHSKTCRLMDKLQKTKLFQ